MSLAEALDTKQRALEQRLKSLAPVAVAFSGGVDSTLLLAMAHQATNGRALAIAARTPAQPGGHGIDLKGFCAERGIPLIMFDLNEREIPGFMSNPAERCLLCKRSMMGRALEIARENGCRALCDGSNADDGQEDRPGKRALQELGIASPLAECGLTKQEVRALSRKLGLPTANLPSFTCLYTRFPTGRPLDPTLLGPLEQAERLLGNLGFQQVRARIEGPGLRLEVRPDQVARLQEVLREPGLPRQLRDLGFSSVRADPAGYRLGGANR